MSARCLVVAPDYGALPETLANFNIRYDWTEDLSIHAQRFYEHMCTAIENYGSAEVQNKLEFQKKYADMNYSWDVRVRQWTDFLSDLKPKVVRRGSVKWMER